MCTLHVLTNAHVMQRAGGGEAALGRIDGRIPADLETQCAALELLEIVAVRAPAAPAAPGRAQTSLPPNAAGDDWGAAGTIDGLGGEAMAEGAAADVDPSDQARSELRRRLTELLASTGKQAIILGGGSCSVLSTVAEGQPGAAEPGLEPEPEPEPQESTAEGQLTDRSVADSAWDAMPPTPELELEGSVSMALWTMFGDERLARMAGVETQVPTLNEYACAQSVAGPSPPRTRR
jgi:hypothetical protein